MAASTTGTCRRAVASCCSSANLQAAALRGEAFERAWYWSSTQTQFSRYHAYSQGFDYGYTYYFDLKSWEGGRARPVRRFLIG
jgi:hypothetical protein